MTRTARTTTAPAAGLLCGPGAEDLVRAAIGLTPEVELAVRVDRVQHRTDGTSVGYDVTYDASGAVSDYLVASTAPLALAAGGVALLQDGELDVAVWRHPGDPALPGLAAACDVAAVAAWLPGTTGLEVVTYRPLRRAVVRATGVDGVTGYLKVVRPAVADRLVRQHVGTAALGSPRVTARPAPGVLVLAEVPGATLAEAIADGRRAPDLDEIVALLDRMDPACASLGSTTSFAQDLPAQLLALTGVLDGDVAVRLRRLADAVVARIARTARRWPVVPTHGDLHAANLVVRPGPTAELAGVLDVDRVGGGHRVDDLACLFAHASVAATSTDGSAAADVAAQRARTAVERWWAQARRTDAGDAAALAARTAAVVLALVGVVAPERVTALLDLAGAWCARASLPTVPLPRSVASGNPTTITTKEMS
ncbi:phosphotransferase [Serinibacter arcticus]|nr:phosphotransferase [Serinibacter arcticus]